MKPQDLQRYAKIVSDVIEATQTNGEDLNADYETLRKAIDSDQVSDLSSDQLTKIKAHFQSGTDKYNDNVNQLQQAPVPVKVLGKHKMLVRAYEDYAAACQAMTDSIDPAKQVVAVDAFNQAEKDQEAHIAKVSDVTTRIMGLLA
ncbi:hypothetical protein FEZ41_12845 [Lentilactobacillus parafarraginis]|uniref:DUF2383 domain-containing protein n=2 Tax=Lentilactobacillus parafarraginis TaxID=390842 RepID=A0A0R1Z2J2_9LACO|nr:hypothetical protein [Lentilactobacillus parafarraginis]KRM45219.1 hypothetical protein FD47_GL002114 [Lentilactobacillus parafarraginis DSM 18390 = JCM 14109]TLQ16677.1 hypothetical protein FEZ41_12845 [Lentilactobacillus parafarraginis]